MSIVNQPTDAEREAAARTRLIAGLRATADWLEANPAVPVGRHCSVRLQYSTSAYIPDLAERRAEVDPVAELLAAKTYKDGTHYGVTKEFGEDVTYLALSVARPRARKATR